MNNQRLVSGNTATSFRTLSRTPRVPVYVVVYVAVYLLLCKIPLKNYLITAGKNYSDWITSLVKFASVN